MVETGNALERLLTIVPPPAGREPRSIAPRWRATLTCDYICLLELYGAGSFDDFLSLHVPDHRNKYLDLQWQHETMTEVLREVAGFKRVPYPIGGDDGLMPWATTANGDVCYWVRAHRRDPDEWTVVVNPGRDPEWEEFDGTATEFLVAALSGDVRFESFPDDFPSPQPRFVPCD
jgi:hypothetical protein